MLATEGKCGHTASLVGIPTQGGIITVPLPPAGTGEDLYPIRGRGHSETTICRTCKEFRASGPDSMARGDVPCREKRHPVGHLSIEVPRWFSPPSDASRRQTPVRACMRAHGSAGHANGALRGAPSLPLLW